jgi:peptidoglycan-N-acetylglucosamine deacetylase
LGCSVIHVHIDVDDLWIYAAEYGVPLHAVTESVYSCALPRFLDLLDDARTKATFFVVGRDLEHSAARDFCRDAASRGHELANHTFSHPVALHALSPDEKEFEILKADAVIADACGTKPVGFRAPGYYLDGAILQTLARCGYTYDSSIMPTYVQPLFKLYVNMRSGARINKQFGTTRSPLASQRVRRLRIPDSAGHNLYELPISVLPILRFPIHSTFCFHLPRSFRRLAYATLSLRPDSVLLFHAIDAIGEVRSHTLRRSVLPLRLDIETRIDLIREALGIARNRALITTRDRLASLDPQEVPMSKILGFTRAN